MSQNNILSIVSQPFKKVKITYLISCTKRGSRPEFANP